MADRTVRVNLAANTSQFVSGMRTAENAVQAFAKQAVNAKAPFAQLRQTLDLSTTAAQRLGNAGKGIGQGFGGAVADVNRLGTALKDLSGAGVTNTIKQVEKLATAVGKIGQGTGIGDLAQLGTHLHGIAGVNLTAVSTELAKLVREINKLTPGSATELRTIVTALRAFANTSLGTSAADLAQLTTRLRAIVRIPVSDIHALANALRALGTAGGTLGNVGNIGPSLRAMQQQIDQLRASIAQLRNAGGGGGGPGGGSGGGGIFDRLFGSSAAPIAKLAGAAAGLVSFGAAVRSTVAITADFQTSMATLGVVTNTTGTPALAAASEKAQQLGADATIAGASAADAAVAMQELAKGGFSIADSMTAAKATLQLAAAASVDAATAAGIQAQALNAFSLDASHAGEVADLLANTANAATGDIGDFALGLQQAGQPAAALGISIRDTLITLAEFAKAGIKGSDAGTSLKSMLLALETPTAKQAQAIDKLGITVYDATGHFEGMRQVQVQLAAARKKMTDEEYNATTALVFGSDAVRAAGIAAKFAGQGFDDVGAQMDTAGGVAKASEAKMSGLAGAFGNLRNQVENAQIDIGQKFSPVIEAAVGKIADLVPQLSAAITGGGGGGIGGIGTRLANVFKPLISSAGDVMGKAWPYIRDFGESIGRVFSSIVTFIQPVATALGNFFKTAAANGSIDKLGGVLVGIGRGFQGIASFLAPIGSAIGSVIKWFTDLGPVATTAGVALVGLTLLKGPLLGLFNATIGAAIRGTTTAIGSFGAQVRLLQGLTGISRLSATLNVAAGAAANFGKGLLAAFGGPIGLAIVGITTALAFLPGLFSKNADSSADFTKNVDGLTASLDANTGAITDNTKAQVADDLVKSGTAKRAQQLGLNLDAVNAAALNSAGGMDMLNASIGASVAKNIAASDSYTDVKTNLDEAGISVADLTTAVQSGDFSAVKGKYDAYIATIKDSTRASAAATEEQRALNSITQAAPGIMEPYLGVLKDVGGENDAIGTSVENAKLKLALLSTGFDDTVRHADAAAGAYGTTAVAMSAADRAAADLAKQVETVGQAGQAIAHYGPIGLRFAVDDKGVGQFFTDAQQEFSDYKQQVTDAQTTTELFFRELQILSGKDFSLAERLDNDATAIRGYGQALRDSAQALLDQKTARAAYETAVANKGKTETVDATDDQGNKYKKTQLASDATTDADIAAAANAMYEANLKVAGSAGIVTKAQGEAAKAVLDTVEAEGEAALAKGGYNAAVTAGIASLAQQRKAYVDSYVAGKQAMMTDEQKAASLKGLTAEAGRNADAIKLIPDKKTVEFLFSKDPKFAEKAAEATKAATEKAQKEAKIKFAADMKDARATMARFGTDVSKFPKAVRTKFDADVKDATSKGKGLYSVYNRTTGNFDAMFLTPNAAAAKAKAGDLVTQYDAAKGTWNANLTATDAASGTVAGVQAALNGVTDKTVDLKVRLLGTSDEGTVTNNLGVGIFGTAKKATGGMVYGPGTATSDSIPARLSNGEFVVRASQTEKYRPLLESINQGAPGFATGGMVGTTKNYNGLKINATAEGNIDPAISGLRNIYAAADADVAKQNAAVDAQVAAAKAAAAKAAAIPAASSAGVEQWRALANHVAAVKGEAPASVQVMLNQMAHESSGNPAAINLTDSNAQAGHPSVGLLQFIPTTFAANADPGFSSNIYDPESQMRAFYNYINANYGGWAEFAKRNYIAYAEGGPVSGPGTGTSDSINARLSNGEFVVNSRATAEHLPLLQQINGYAQGGPVGYASGGLVAPSARNLSGQQDPSYGERRSTVQSALDGFGPLVEAAAQAVIDAKNTLRDALKTQSTARTDYTAALKNEADVRAQQKLAATRDAEDEKKARSEAAAAGRTGTQAERNTAKAAEVERRKQKARQDADTKRSNNDALVAAITQTRAARATLVAANSSEVASSRAAASASKHAAALDAEQRAQARNQHSLLVLSQRFDDLTPKLTAAQDKLASLRTDRANLASSVSSTVAGFDGGITGHSETRNTFETILKGQQYNLKQEDTFRNNLAALKARGLDSATLSSIAGAGVDGGGVTAAALAKASKAQIKQLNDIVIAQKKRGDAAGSTVASAMYDAGIASAQGLVSGLQSQEKAIAAAMVKLASIASAAFKNALKIKSPSRVFHEHGMNIGKGVELGVNATRPAVNAAVGHLVELPAVQRVPVASAANQPMQVQVWLDGERIDARAQVVVNGALVELRDSYRKVGDQS